MNKWMKEWCDWEKLKAHSEEFNNQECGGFLSGLQQLCSMISWILEGELKLLWVEAESTEGTEIIQKEDEWCHIVARELEKGEQN